MLFIIILYTGFYKVLIRYKTYVNMSYIYDKLHKTHTHPPNTTVLTVCTPSTLHTVPMDLSLLYTVAISVQLLIWQYFFCNMRLAYCNIIWQYDTSVFVMMKDSYLMF